MLGAMAGAEESIVVVSSSMLHQAAKDAGAAEAGIRLVNLQPPGRCPGHFDVRPQQWSDVRGARVILCHDYQAALRQRFGGMRDIRAPIIASTPGSFLVPDHYLQLLAQVSDSLQQAFPEQRDHFLREEEAAIRRLAEREAALRERAKPWEGIPVIASVMQREFAEWLGLDVVGVLPRPEDLTPRAFAALRRSPARAVIGNLQSDGEAAIRLGARMHIPAVVWSNFPEAEGYGVDLEALLENNLQRLHRAVVPGEAPGPAATEEAPAP